MLSSIQRDLSTLYDLEVEARVEDFVLGSEAVEEAFGDDSRRGEMLVVMHGPHDAHVGLYVDPDIVDRARASGGVPGEHFPAYCTALEGVSHFLYWMFRAENHQPLSQLELEFQAEVDKYASGLLGSRLPLEGQGAGLMALRGRSQILRESLFSEVRFIDQAGTERGDRYRQAHRLAVRYTQSLEDGYIDTGDLGGLVTELRRFYRLGLQEKIRQAG
ncbi:MAG: hypothetical protein KC416_06590 [Myxococcales bacterium]|nr:hypothetical protein [Myxococcales bacterium]